MYWHGSCIFAYKDCNYYKDDFVSLRVVLLRLVIEEKDGFLFNLMS